MKNKGENMHKEIMKSIDKMEKIKNKEFKKIWNEPNGKDALNAFCNWIDMGDNLDSVKQRYK